jgi:hypothetical protein
VKRRRSFNRNTKEESSVIKIKNQEENTYMIKNGDIVARKSYNKDILFVVDRIIRMVDNTSLVILKGLTLRIEADAPLRRLRNGR